MEERVCSPTDVEVALSVSWLWMLLLTLSVVPLVVVCLKVDCTLTVVVAGDSVVDTVDTVVGEVEVDNLVVVVSAPWEMCLIICSNLALLLW